MLDLCDDGIGETVLSELFRISKQSSDDEDLPTSLQPISIPEYGKL